MALEELKSLEKPVVTLADVAKARNISRESAAVWITRQAKANHITKIEKGKYAITNDAFAIATSLVFPSYLSFSSALYLHGMLDQVPNRLQVVSPKYKRSVSVANASIDFVVFQKERIFGYERKKRGEFFAFIAEPEKAVVDCLYAPKHFPISYLESAFQSINTAKLEDFALKMKSVALIKRTGYLLEHFGIKTSLKAKSGVHHLVPGVKGKWDNKWRLYV